MLLPAAGHPERTLAQEALLRSRSQQNDRALFCGQVPHVPLFQLLLSPCGYLHLRRSRTWHPGQFQDPSAGLWKFVRSAFRAAARLYFASSDAIRTCAESLSGHRRPPSEERPGRRNPPLFPAPEAVGREEIREAHNRRDRVPPSLGQALRPSSVPETLSKLARRHRIGRLRPLGNPRSGTTTQSDLRKRAGGWTDWLI